MTSIPTDPSLFMQKTNEIAKIALEAGELPIAAIVVYNNEIISSAYALDRSEKRRLVHAELLALDKIDKIKPFPGKRSEMALFVNLEPCLMCLGTALVFGVGALFYSLESPVDGSIHFASTYSNQLSQLPGYNVPNIYSGLERDKTLRLFNLYINKSKNNGYRKWAQKLLLSLQQKNNGI